MSKREEMLEMAVRLRATVSESKRHMLDAAAQMLEDAAPLAVCPVRPCDRVWLLVRDYRAGDGEYVAVAASVYGVKVSMCGWGIEAIWFDAGGDGHADLFANLELGTKWFLTEDEARRAAGERTDAQKRGDE